LEASDADIFISFQQNSKFEDNIKDDKQFCENLFGKRLKYFGFDDEEYINTIKNTRYDYVMSKHNVEQQYINKIKFSLDQFARAKNIAEKFEQYEIENNCNYDIIVKFRLDRFYWTSPVNFRLFMDSDKLYVPYRYINWSPEVPMGNKKLALYAMKNFVLNMYENIDLRDEIIQTQYLNLLPEVQYALFVNNEEIFKGQIKECPELYDIFKNQKYIKKESEYESIYIMS
jgi:hypothetical protein